MSAGAPPSDALPAPPPGGLRARLRELFEGDSPQGRRFRLGLLALGLVSLVLVAFVSFLPRHPAVLFFEAFLGLVLLAEFLARNYASSRLGRDLLRASSLADIAAIGSLLAAPFVTHGLGFLRALRFLRGQVATVCAVFAHVCMVVEADHLAGVRFGNAVLIASQVPFPVAELAVRAAADDYPAEVVHGADLRAFASGYEAVTDATATGSPVPPRGVFGSG